ncbi:[LysW]-lysine hydrolase [Deinococcus maricopensis]|uniref:[LysW]-lysine hydrolase n=1 Tax=Deinococcus maricopensis (strain DSM 21211 / LMG 22137 / NRRL B-23946 / LB-34) TaxID=709986 RepID=E8UAY7_DEIML|nr:[LysW]-lysine hydrolase [Deinococcus maricopensis]ADV68226.1 N-acetyl-ornithine/N-acetyl-lysine deacetylase [Deinococcus maricopensis DSM 21211]
MTEHEGTAAALRDARALIAGAVGVPSVSGEEAAVAAYLADWMRAHDFTAHVDEAGNAVGERGRGPLTVVLLGHIDTVPGDIPVRVDEAGVLHGRGSVDAKGSFCTFVAAVAALGEDALHRARFVCVGATEEEAPSSRGARHAVTQYAPDAVFIGEPSGWAGITLGYKGRLVVKASVEKDNFHSAGDGTSAADDLAEYWFRARAWAATAGGSSPFEAVQATVQALSSDADGLTQRAHATIGLRLPVGLTPQDAEAHLRDLAGDLPVTLVFVGHEVAVRHDRDSRVARALRVAIRAHGGTPVFKVKTGTSDMNVVAPHWAAPTVAYGPGDSKLDHTPEERLDLAEYDRAVLVLRDALTRLVAD